MRRSSIQRGSETSAKKETEEYVVKNETRSKEDDKLSEKDQDEKCPSGKDLDNQCDKTETTREENSPKNQNQTIECESETSKQTIELTETKVEVGLSEVTNKDDTKCEMVDCGDRKTDCDNKVSDSNPSKGVDKVNNDMSQDSHCPDSIQEMENSARTETEDDDCHVVESTENSQNSEPKTRKRKANTTPRRGASKRKSLRLSKK